MAAADVKMSDTPAGNDEKTSKEREKTVQESGMDGIAGLYLLSGGGKRFMDHATQMLADAEEESPHTKRMRRLVSEFFQDPTGRVFGSSSAQASEADARLEAFFDQLDEQDIEKPDEPDWEDFNAVNSIYTKCRAQIDAEGKERHSVIGFSFMQMTSSLLKVMQELCPHHLTPSSAILLEQTVKSLEHLITTPPFSDFTKAQCSRDYTITGLLASIHETLAAVYSSEHPEHVRRVAFSLAFKLLQKKSRKSVHAVCTMAHALSFSKQAQLCVQAEDVRIFAKTLVPSLALGTPFWGENDSDDENEASEDWKCPKPDSLAVGFVFCQNTTCLGPVRLAFCPTHNILLSALHSSTGYCPVPGCTFTTPSIKGLCKFCQLSLELRELQSLLSVEQLEASDAAFSRNTQTKAGPIIVWVNLKVDTLPLISPELADLDHLVQRTVHVMEGSAEKDSGHAVLQALEHHMDCASSEVKFHQFPMPSAFSGAVCTDKFGDLGTAEEKSSSPGPEIVSDEEDTGDDYADEEGDNQSHESSTIAAYSDESELVEAENVVLAERMSMLEKVLHESRPAGRWCHVLYCQNCRCAVVSGPTVGVGDISHPASCTVDRILSSFRAFLSWDVYRRLDAAKHAHVQSADPSNLLSPTIHLMQGNRRAHYFGSQASVCVARQVLQSEGSQPVFELATLSAAEKLSMLLSFRSDRLIGASQQDIPVTGGHPAMDRLLRDRENSPSELRYPDEPDDVARRCADYLRQRDLLVPIPTPHIFVPRSAGATRLCYRYKNGADNPDNFLKGGRAVSVNMKLLELTAMTLKAAWNSVISAKSPSANEKEADASCSLDSKEREAKEPFSEEDPPGEDVNQCHSTAAVGLNNPSLTSPLARVLCGSRLLRTSLALLHSENISPEFCLLGREILVDVPQGAQLTRDMVNAVRCRIVQGSREIAETLTNVVSQALSLLQDHVKLIHNDSQSGPIVGDLQRSREYLKRSVSGSQTSHRLSDAVEIIAKLMSGSQEGAILRPTVSTLLQNARLLLLIVEELSGTLALLPSPLLTLSVFLDVRACLGSFMSVPNMQTVLDATTCKCLSHLLDYELRGGSARDELQFPEIFVRRWQLVDPARFPPCTCKTESDPYRSSSYGSSTRPGRDGHGCGADDTRNLLRRLLRKCLEEQQGADNSLLWSHLFHSICLHLFQYIGHKLRFPKKGESELCYIHTGIWLVSELANTAAWPPSSSTSLWRDFLLIRLVSSSAGRAMSNRPDLAPLSAASWLKENALQGWATQHFEKLALLSPSFSLPDVKSVIGWSQPGNLEPVSLVDAQTVLTFFAADRLASFCARTLFHSGLPDAFPALLALTPTDSKNLEEQDWLANPIFARGLFPLPSEPLPTTTEKPKHEYKESEPFISWLAGLQAQAGSGEPPITILKVKMEKLLQTRRQREGREAQYMQELRMRSRFRQYGGVDAATHAVFIACAHHVGLLGAVLRIVAMEDADCSASDFDVSVVGTIGRQASDALVQVWSDAVQIQSWLAMARQQSDDAYIQATEFLEGRCRLLLSFEASYAYEVPAQVSESTAEAAFDMNPPPLKRQLSEDLRRFRQQLQIWRHVSGGDASTHHKSVPDAIRKVVMSFLKSRVDPRLLHVRLCLRLTAAQNRCSALRTMRSLFEAFVHRLQQNSNSGSNSIAMIKRLLSHMNVTKHNFDVQHRGLLPNVATGLTGVQTSTLTELQHEFHELVGVLYRSYRTARAAGVPSIDQLSLSALSCAALLYEWTPGDLRCLSSCGVIEDLLPSDRNELRVLFDSDAHSGVLMRQQAFLEILCLTISTPENHTIGLNSNETGALSVLMSRAFEAVTDLLECANDVFEEASRGIVAREVTVTAVEVVLRCLSLLRRLCTSSNAPRPTDRSIDAQREHTKETATLQLPLVRQTTDGFLSVASCLSTANEVCRNEALRFIRARPFVDCVRRVSMSLPSVGPSATALATCISNFLESMIPSESGVTDRDDVMALQSDMAAVAISVPQPDRATERKAAEDAKSDDAFLAKSIGQANIPSDPDCSPCFMPHCSQMFVMKCVYDAAEELVDVVLTAVDVTVQPNVEVDNTALDLVAASVCTSAMDEVSQWNCNEQLTCTVRGKPPRDVVLSGPKQLLPHQRNVVLVCQTRSAPDSPIKIAVQAFDVDKNTWVLVFDPFVNEERKQIIRSPPPTTLNTRLSKSKKALRYRRQSEAMKAKKRDSSGALDVSNATFASLAPPFVSSTSKLLACVYGDWLVVVMPEVLEDPAALSVWVLDLVARSSPRNPKRWFGMRSKLAKALGKSGFQTTKLVADEKRGCLYLCDCFMSRALRFCLPSQLLDANSQSVPKKFFQDQIVLIHVILFNPLKEWREISDDATTHAFLCEPYLYVAEQGFVVRTNVKTFPVKRSTTETEAIDWERLDCWAPSAVDPAPWRGLMNASFRDVSSGSWQIASTPPSRTPGCLMWLMASKGTKTSRTFIDHVVMSTHAAVHSTALGAWEPLCLDTDAAKFLTSVRRMCRAATPPINMDYNWERIMTLLAGLLAPVFGCCYPIGPPNSYSVTLPNADRTNSTMFAVTGQVSTSDCRGSHSDVSFSVSFDRECPMSARHLKVDEACPMAAKTVGTDESKSGAQSPLPEVRDFVVKQVGGEGVEILGEQPKTADETEWETLLPTLQKLLPASYRSLDRNSALVPLLRCFWEVRPTMVHAAAQLIISAPNLAYHIGMTHHPREEWVIGASQWDLKVRFRRFPPSPVGSGHRTFRFQEHLYALGGSHLQDGSIVLSTLHRFVEAASAWMEIPVYKNRSGPSLGISSFQVGVMWDDMIIVHGGYFLPGDDIAPLSEVWLLRIRRREEHCQPWIAYRTSDANPEDLCVEWQLLQSEPLAGGLASLSSPHIRKEMKPPKLYNAIYASKGGSLWMYGGRSSDNSWTSAWHELQLQLVPHSVAHASDCEAQWIRTSLLVPGMLDNTHFSRARVGFRWIVHDDNAPPKSYKDGSGIFVDEYFIMLGGYTRGGDFASKNTWLFDPHLSRWVCLSERLFGHISRDASHFTTFYDPDVRHLYLLPAVNDGDVHFLYRLKLGDIVDKYRSCSPVASFEAIQSVGVFPSPARAVKSRETLDTGALIAKRGPTLTPVFGDAVNVMTHPVDVFSVPKSVEWHSLAVFGFERDMSATTVIVLPSSSVYEQRSSAIFCESLGPYAATLSELSGQLQIRSANAVSSPNISETAVRSLHGWALNKLQSPTPLLLLVVLKWIRGNFKPSAAEVIAGLPFGNSFIAMLKVNSCERGLIPGDIRDSTLLVWYDFLRQTDGHTEDSASVGSHATLCDADELFKHVDTVGENELAATEIKATMTAAQDCKHTVEMLDSGSVSENEPDVPHEVVDDEEESTAGIPNLLRRVRRAKRRDAAIERAKPRSQRVSKPPILQASAKWSSVNRGPTSVTQVFAPRAEEHFVVEDDHAPSLLFQKTDDEYAEIRSSRWRALLDALPLDSYSCRLVFSKLTIAERAYLNDIIRRELVIRLSSGILGELYRTGGLDAGLRSIPGGLQDADPTSSKSFLLFLLSCAVGRDRQLWRYTSKSSDKTALCSPGSALGWPTLCIADACTDLNIFQRLLPLLLAASVSLIRRSLPNQGGLSKAKRSPTVGQAQRESALGVWLASLSVSASLLHVTADVLTPNALQWAQLFGVLENAVYSCESAARRNVLWILQEMLVHRERFSNTDPGTFGKRGCNDDVLAKLAFLVERLTAIDKKVSAGASRCGTAVTALEFLYVHNELFDRPPVRHIRIQKGLDGLLDGDGQVSVVRVARVAGYTTLDRLFALKLVAARFSDLSPEKQNFCKQCVRDLKKDASAEGPFLPDWGKDAAQMIALTDAERKYLFRLLSLARFIWELTVPTVYLVANKTARSATSMSLPSDLIHTVQELVPYFSRRKYLLACVKQLSVTLDADNPEIEVDRLKATRAAQDIRNIIMASHQAGGGAQSEEIQFMLPAPTVPASMVLKTWFGQLCDALSRYPCSIFQEPGGQYFSVQLVGEGGIDAGGPFREVLDSVSQELQSQTLPLLIPTPNHFNNQGEYRDCFIANPSATSPADLHMYRMLGRFIGGAICTGNLLNLHLAPSFWRQLQASSQPAGGVLVDGAAGRAYESVENCHYDLLAEIDSLTASVMQNIADNTGDLTEDSFSAVVDETFCLPRSDRSIIELIPGGRAIAVTFETRVEYVSRAVMARLREADTQMHAVREGVSDVVPPDILGLFSWTELEYMVCGDARVDLSYLKANTVDRLDDPQRSQMFWSVLEQFTDDQLKLFLKFTWGRTRLPLAGQEWDRKFRLDVGSGVDSLPLAHTCFFTIDLPKYSSQAMMKKQILYAISNCSVIDMDNEGVDRTAWGLLDQEAD